MKTTSKYDVEGSFNIYKKEKMLCINFEYKYITVSGNLEGMFDEGMYKEPLKNSPG